MLGLEAGWGKVVSQEWWREDSVREEVGMKDIHRLETGVVISFVEASVYILTGGLVDIQRVESGQVDITGVVRRVDVKVRTKGGRICLKQLIKISSILCPF